MNDAFKEIFEQMEKGEPKQVALVTEDMRDTLEQSNEIRELINLIEESTPANDPILYSGS